LPRRRFLGASAAAIAGGGIASRMTAAERPQTPSAAGGAETHTTEGVKFGAVTHALGHAMSFEQTLAAIRKLGFDSILMLTTREGEPVRADGTCPKPFPDVLRSDPQHVLRAMNNADLAIGAVHFSGKLDLESDEGAERALLMLREYAERTLALGCRILTHPIPSCGRAHAPTEEKAPIIARLARCMNDTAEAFADQGLIVACDIHYRAWVEGVDDCRLLLDSMPCQNAGLVLNVGHLTTAQAYGWILVEEYPDRIPVVGWKDHSLARDRPRPVWSIELGTGHTPFELYVQRFKQHPRERLHLINCENAPDEERRGSLGRSLDYMRRLFLLV
jgi:sugar phosphate isomerase/epimerase